MSDDTGGHWYDSTGKPCHTYTNAKGERKKTGLAEARKRNLFPSFSTVVKSTLQNQQIVEYAKRCVAKAAYRDPAFDDEEEPYVERIIAASDNDRDGAADLGTSIHAAIEDFLHGKPYDPAYAVYVECARAFLAEHEIHICELEKTFSSLTYGFGGTIDLAGKSHGRDVIVDWKSRRTKPGEKVRSYESQPMQIGAYFTGIFDRVPTEAIGFNVYLSTTEPGRMNAVPYCADELSYEFAQFHLLLNYWQNRKKFWPHIIIKGQDLTKPE